MANLVGMFGLHNDADKDEDWEQVKTKITGLGEEHPFKINQVSTEQDLLVHLKENNCLRWAQLRDMASENPDIVEMEKDMLKFFGQMYYGKLSQLTGIPLAVDDHAKAREICSTIYWMKQSKKEFRIDLTAKDFNFCQAITDVELYTQQALFSRDALAIQTHEFAAIMADFADLTHERRGLDFNVLPMAKFFRDKYYTDYTQKVLPDMKINSFPEILHFSGH